MSLLLALTNQVYTESATGGAQSGGAAAALKVKAVVGGGAVQSAGTGVVARAKAVAGVGGAQSGGAATFLKAKAPAGAGGGQSGGAGTAVKVKALTGSGDALTSGSAFRVTLIFRSGGGLLQSGGAGAFVKAKAIPGAGGGQSGGGGAFPRAVTITGSGGAQSGGVAAVAKGKAFAGSGGATPGTPAKAEPLVWPDATAASWPDADPFYWPAYVADLAWEKVVIGAGGTSAGGEAVTGGQHESVYEGSGGVTADGAAEFVREKVVTGAGGARAAGFDLDHPEPMTPEPPPMPAGGGWWGVPYWRPEPPKRRERKPARPKETSRPTEPVHYRFVGSGGAVAGGAARVVFRPGAKPTAPPRRPVRPPRRLPLARPRADDEAAVLAALELFGWGRPAPVRAYAEWDPARHPRGQPENKGEFAPGGGGPPGGKPKATVKARVTVAPPADRAKFVGQPVGKAEHVHAAAVEAEVATAVGGRVAERVAGKQIAYDVAVGDNAVEVKSLLKGEKQSISVHDDALARKVAWHDANPDGVFHTVIVDDRETYDGGRYAANYSGHRIYYKRGSGRYGLAQAYKVRDAAELGRLIRTPDAGLPEAARGSLPPPPPTGELRARAEKAHAARLAKDRARKARLKVERLQAAGA